MIIDYCNLENVFLSRNGNLRKNNTLLVEMDSCAVCNKSYLTIKSRPSIFCSLSCSQSGSNNSVAGQKPHNWKGGVRKLGLPLYNTYAKQLDYVETVKPYIDDKCRKLLQVKCNKCRNWFVPSIDQVSHRIKSLNGVEVGENRLYCSQECKDRCEVYNKQARNYIFINNSDKVYTNTELSIWSKEVLTRANYKCEVCGGKAEHVHHIQPKKLKPGYALDPDNGLAVCEDCHYKYGHKYECSTGNIANIKCGKL